MYKSPFLSHCQSEAKSLRKGYVIRCFLCSEWKNADEAKTIVGVLPFKSLQISDRKRVQKIVDFEFGKRTGKMGIISSLGRHIVFFFHL